ncbi:MAG: hypothetical protein JWO79_1470 [Actinomycetia bacterium]|nr:hypothetical protein [Actinomycetes bacterium]
MICLVRHAHAGDKQGWIRDDELRPLSRTGWQEAAGLLVQLGGVRISAVLASPAVRCVQTVRDLAADRGLAVATDARLGRDRPVADLLAVATERPEDGGTVLCSHGETIGALLAFLRGAGAPIPADAEWPKGSAWLLDVRRGSVAAARYLPPLRIAAPADPQQDFAESRYRSPQ